MHLTPKYINIIINILLGAAWGSALYGFIYGYVSTFGNFFIKLSSGILHFFAGLFFVLFLEFIYVQFKKYEEQKKTNRLLKELLEKKVD